MALDADPPEPPSLTNRGLPEAFDAADLPGGEGALRRADIEGFLDDGAWQEAFEEWSSYTDLSDEQFETVRDLGLFQRIDVYWNPEDGGLDYDAPTLPADLPAGADARDLDASLVETELDDLGRAVVEMLADAYLDWGDEAVEDVVWSDETFGQMPDEEAPDRDAG